MFLRILLFSFFLSGCTVHQNERIRELLVKDPECFPRTKDLAIVRESLESPSDAFHLALDSISGEGEKFPGWVLKGEKIPLEERFIFAVVDGVTKEIDPQYEFEVLESGDIRIFGKNGIRVEKEILFVEDRVVLAGSSIEYVVVSKEHYTSSRVSFMPSPIEVKGAAAERIQLEVTHPMGTHFELSGSGFYPAETILITHTSGDVTNTFEEIADEKGEFSLEVNPTIFGKMGGEASVSVVAKGGTFSLEYPWGAHLSKRSFEEKGGFPILFVINPSLEEMDRALIRNGSSYTNH